MPLFGGTLLVSRDGQFAYATEPGRDLLHVIELESFALLRSVALPAGSRPVALTEDPGGTLHVVLRGSGHLASLDPHAPENLLARAACRTPRGVTYDAVTDSIAVVCRSGELVQFTGEQPGQARFVAMDLRDVVSSDEGLWLSTFRRVGAHFQPYDGGTAARYVPAPTVSDDRGDGIFEPHIAVRTVNTGAGAFVLHQRASLSEIGGSYGQSSECGQSVSHNGLSKLDDSGGSWHFRALGRLTIGTPLDLAMADDGQTGAVLATTSVGVLLSWLDVPSAEEVVSPCGDVPALAQLELSGWPSALALEGSDRVLVQRHSPPGLVRLGFDATLASLTELSVLDFASEPRLPRGAELFYQTTRLGLSCATCHPEGHEDGTTWSSTRDGLRRTQNIAGGVFATAPLHWPGDRVDFTAVLEDTLVQRMSGTLPDAEGMEQLAAYIDGLPNDPAPRAADDPQAVQGRVWFEQLQCDACHSGELLTDNLNHDVGTGQSLQTPSLRGVAYRTPLMHKGCASNLRARFSDCGGDERHGKWQTLEPEQLDQLVAYLESL